MDENGGLSASNPSQVRGAEAELPPGDHPLEIAARSGIGPLSSLGKEVWHGKATPCVSCGQLVRRDQPVCDHCEQDLSPEMLARMHAHSGPWFVLEHVRPFPGVKIERIVRQVKRGVLTETSILRGPETDFQWRFAGETPGLCRFFNRCWKCHRSVSQDNTHCPSCRVSLLFRNHQALETTGQQKSEPKRAAVPTSNAATERPPATPPHTARTAASEKRSRNAELEVLKSVIEENPSPPRAMNVTIPRTENVVRVLWLPIAMLVVFVLGLAWLSNCRTVAQVQPTPAQSSPLDLNPSQ